MKKIVFLLSFIIFTTAHASTYTITSVTPYLRDMVFELANDTDDQIVLDCSSFLHNLTIKSLESETIIYLSEGECWGVFEFFIEPSQKNRCLTNDSTDFRYHNCSEEPLDL